jgi:hypothetical protein
MAATTTTTTVKATAGMKAMTDIITCMAMGDIVIMALTVPMNLVTTIRIVGEGGGNGCGGKSRGRDTYARYESNGGYGMGRGYEDAYEDNYTPDMPDMMRHGRYPRGGHNPSPSTYDDEDSGYGSNYGDRSGSHVPDADFWVHGAGNRRPLTAANLVRVGDAAFILTEDRWTNRAYVHFVGRRH